MDLSLLILGVLSLSDLSPNRLPLPVPLRSDRHSDPSRADHEDDDGDPDEEGAPI